jgi:hypothetical protein
VLVAGVDVQLAQLRSDRLDQLASGVDVTLQPEEGVALHAVHLHRDAVRPRPEGPLAGDREARLVQQRAASAGASLGQFLGHAHAERDARVDEVVGQVGEGLLGALAEGLVSDCAGQRGTLVDDGGQLAVEQVRRVHGVSTGSQAVGEGAHAVGESLDVVEQHDLGHPPSLDDHGRSGAGRSAAWTTVSPVTARVSTT